MKISYNWLKQYVKTEESPVELSALLTDSGLEVEGLEKYETIPGGLKGVVTGKVLSCEKHPDADRLTLTTVDVGEKEPLPIVCGAPNVEPGQKVMVATLGTILHTGKGPFEIKKAKIRGQVSEGMICAEDELGVGTSHDGIMVLPEDTEIGTPASRYFDIKEDWIIEIGLTPNRIDAASHVGVARDVVAVLNHQKKQGGYRLEKPSVEGFAPDNHDLEIPITIEDPGACPRYCGLTISGVKVKDSPAWLQKRLMSIGLKPINNVVDATNFVLHELGQPLHAFDAAKIEGKKVIVKKPPRGTVFETLDEEKLELTGEDLMICNEKEPMCLAGILGGIGSGVTRDTRDIFLESACFDAVTIRKSSKQHGLKTDASFRFERGADPDITVYALKRAAMLIKEVAGGKISSGVQDVYPRKMEPLELEFSFFECDRLIGKPIPREEIKNILHNLDFSILKESPEALRLSVPPYRVDVTRGADVVEEILRIYGYNNVELPEKLHSSIVLSPKPDKEHLQNIVSETLTSRGFYEIMNNSLTKGAYYGQEGFDASRSVEILNPLSHDLNVLRQTLLFGGLETIAYNQNRKVQDLKLYEFGNVYEKDSSKANPGKPLSVYDERMELALFVTGRREPETWNATDAPTGFFDLKAAVMAVLSRLGVETSQLEMKQQEEGAQTAFSLELIYKNKPLAMLGQVSQKLCKAFDIKQEVYYARLQWESLVHLYGQQTLTYRDIPKFPEVRRDLALLIDRGVSFAEIEKLAFETEKKLLKQVGLFDVYQDEKLGKNKKSYALSFILRDENKTLTDKEIDKAMEKISRTLEKKAGAEIRR